METTRTPDARTFKTRRCPITKAWRGGEVLDGEFIAMTGRHSTKAAAARELQDRIARLTAR